MWLEEQRPLEGGGATVHLSMLSFAELPVSMFAPLLLTHWFNPILSTLCTPACRRQLLAANPAVGDETTPRTIVKIVVYHVPFPLRGYRGPLWSTLPLNIGIICLQVKGNTQPCLKIRFCATY